MSSKFKTLGLALVASLALSAILASMAQATFSFTAPEGAVNLTGNQVTQKAFTTSGGEMKCNSVIFTGTTTAASSTQQLFEPHYSGCTSFGFTAHVNATGCSYLFTTPTVKLTPTEYTGAPPHLVCAGGGITITPTFFGASMCTTLISAQTPTSGHVIYKNEGAGTTRDVLMTTTTSGTHYTSTGGICGESGKTLTDGASTGSMTIKGFKHNLAHTTANHRAWVID